MPAEPRADPFASPALSSPEVQPPDDPRIPVEVQTLPERLPAARAGAPPNPIDLHPARDDIAQVVGMWLLEPASKRPSPAEFRQTLMVLFDGLDLSPYQFDSFTKRVAKSVTLTGEFMRKGLLAAGKNLNSLERKLNIATRLDEEMERLQERDEHGDLVIPLGQKETMADRAKAIALIGKAAESSWSSYEDTCERLGLLPSKKSESRNLHLHAVAGLDAGGIVREQGGSAVRR